MVVNVIIINIKIISNFYSEEINTVYWIHFYKNACAEEGVISSIFLVLWPCCSAYIPYDISEQLFS